MKKENIKKILSIILISVTIFGVGGITISLVNITIIFGNENNNKSNPNIYIGENDKISEQDIITVESSNDIQNYDNSVKIKAKCASVWARDTNQEYIPVSYAMIELDENLRCILRNDSQQYYAEIDDGDFVFRNVVPGEYIIWFDGSMDYLSTTETISIFENSQIEQVIETQYHDDTLYEEYKVSYEKLKDEFYVFMDAEGEDRIVDGLFKTDANGTLYFKVAWNLPHDVHIHLANGGHAGINIKEQYNGGIFIN